MPDIAPAFEWSLSLLHTTDTKLPLQSFSPFLSAAVRYFKSLNPIAGAAYADDSLTENAKELFNEAIGYRAVGIWLSTPPAPGFETLLKEELGNGLAESYQGWSRDKISMSLLAQAESSFAGVDLVQVGASGSRASRSYLTRARPTRTARTDRTTLMGRIYAGSDSGEF